MKKRAISLFLLIVMLISLVPAQAIAEEAVAGESAVATDVETTADETNLTVDEPVPDGEVEIIPMPEEEYEEVIEEPEATEKPAIDENGENDAADGEGENEDGEDAEKDAEVEETEEDAEHDEDKLFPGMPEGYTLSAEQIAGKQALNAYGVVDTLCKATAGVDYADGEVFFLADTLEYAQTVANAYGAELARYSSGVATLKLNGATVLDAVTAAADMSSNMPVVEANYICKINPVIETDGGNISTYAYRDENDLSVKGSWKTWYESMGDAADQYMRQPSSWDYQYMHDIVNTYEAWGVTKGSGVTVAVVDTGVCEHDDIGDNLKESESVRDWGEIHCSYGTQTAGIIAAEMGNGIGVAGIAPDANIYSERVMEYDSFSYDDLEVAVENVIAAKADDPSIKVMNIGGAGYGYSYGLEEVFRKAVNSGITVVAPMGDDATNIQMYPTAYNIPGLIAVQSSNAANVLSSFSNCGAWADVTAPGSDIMSTVDTDDYEMVSGTWAAAAVVSGVCALYLSVYPDASPVQVEAAIKKATNKGIVDASKLFNAENKAPTITPQEKKSKDGSLPYDSYIEIAAADSAETIIYTVGSQTPSIKNGVVTGTVVDVSDGESFLVPITSEYGFTVGKNVSVKAAAVNGFGMMSKVKTLSVKVGYAEPTGVDIIDPPSKLIPGKSCTLSAKVYPAEANQKVTWDIAKPDDFKGTSLGAKTGVLKAGAKDEGTIAVRAYAVNSDGEEKWSEEITIEIKKADPTKKISLFVENEGKDDGYYPDIKYFCVTSYGFYINEEHKELSVELIPVSFKANAPSEAVWDEEYTWKSSNPKVVTVDTDGIITSVGLGSATITCTATDGSNVKATLTVKVLSCANEISISGLSVVAPGKTAQYTATLEPKNVNYKTVTWSIDEDYYGITIDKRGKVTVPKDVEEGTEFTIRANGGSCNAEKTVTVRKDIADIKIFLDDGEVRGGYFEGLRTLNAKDGSLKQATLFTTDALDGYYDDDGNYCFDYDGNCHFSEIQLVLEGNPYCEVEWTSSNKKVATVDEDGYVKAVSPGAAKITCKATDAGRKSAFVSIVVVNPASSVAAVSQMTRSMAYLRHTLAGGKSVRNTATLGDAYGTPTIKKVTWEFAVRAYDASAAEYGPDDYVCEVTDYAADNKLISINKTSGQLTASKKAWEMLSNKVKDEYGDKDYDIIVAAIARTTDGSNLYSYVPYDLVDAPISKLQVQGFDGKLSTSLKLSDYLCTGGGWSCATGVYDESGNLFKNWTVKSGNPNVAAAVMDFVEVETYEGSEEYTTIPVVRIVSGQKAGTATITLTATDGSNKKATITVKVLPAVEAMTIKNGKKIIEEEYTMRKNEKLTLSAELLPKSLNSSSAVAIQWSVEEGQEDILELTPSKNTRSCTVCVNDATAESVELTATCVINPKTYPAVAYSRTITINIAD